MSLFPYNYNNHDKYGSQGSPLHYTEASRLAYDLFFWHSQIAETDNWTQSREAAEEDIDNIALGLMTMLAEPSQLRILTAVGTEAWKAIGVLRSLRKSGRPATDADEALHTVGIETASG
jgi:hypothetical protein